MYREYRIKKRKGGFRIITEPMPELKVLLLNLKLHLDTVPLHDSAHGFVLNRSPKTNALVHRCQDYVLNIDLKDFFPSIKIDPMMNLLREYDFSEEILMWIEHLCFYKGALPQGSPTSPVLSNIFMIDVDIFLFNLAKEKGWRYTRYADDITFSGDSSLKESQTDLILLMKSFLITRGLTINPKKVKLTSRSQCQRVTGIVVNNEKLTIRGKDREDLFLSLKGTSMSDLTESEVGYLEYVSSIDPKFYEKLQRHMA